MICGGTGTLVPGFARASRARFCLRSSPASLKKKKGALPRTGAPYYGGSLNPRSRQGAGPAGYPSGAAPHPPPGGEESAEGACRFCPLPILPCLVRGGTVLHRLIPSAAAPLAVLKGFFRFPKSGTL